MPDQYEAVRSLPFPAIANALGVDIGLFKVRKQGKEHYGPCPVHKPKNNKTSFSFNADGRFQCFSCGAKGRGAIDIVKLARGIGFQQAVELLESIHIAPTPTAPQEEPVLGECRPLEKDTWRKYQVPCEWLEKRVPDAGVRERYGVFCYNNPARRSAYSGRVMVPIKDLQGVLYGYLGRAIVGSTNTTPSTSPAELPPKYLWPKALPKSRFLFGAHELSQQPLPLKVVYLVESPFCVMKFASLGLPAVSSFGWAVSEEQAELLAQLAKGCIFLPDRNKQAECDAVCRALSRRLWLRFPELPEAIHDPECMGRDQILAL